MKLKKKGQIGGTLTWIVSFALILFILAIFLTITFSASFVKNLKVYDLLSESGKNEITLSGDKISGEDLNTVRQLYSVLKTKIEYENQESRIYDLFRLYITNKDKKIMDKIESKLKNDLDVAFDECYSLCVISLDEIKEISGNNCPEIKNKCAIETILNEGYKQGSGEITYNNKKIKFKLIVNEKNG